MIRAVMDIGTNSAKLLIASIEDGDLREVLDTVEVTRLGDGLHESGRLTEGAMQRGLEAIEAFVNAASEFGAESIVAVGTLGLRRATNAADFLSRVAGSTGVTIEVISGEEEARLSFLAATSAIETQGRICVYDIGGGSTELVTGSGTVMEFRRSVELGARVATDRFFPADPIQPEHVNELMAWLDTEFGPLDTDSEAAIGVGGTVTTLAAVALGLDPFDGERVQGLHLTAEEVDRQIELYQSLTLEERRDIVGLIPERADVILAGACVVSTLLRKLEKPATVVSNRGLRHGIFLDRFAQGSE